MALEKISDRNTFKKVMSQGKSAVKVDISQDLHNVFYRGNYGDLVAATIDAHPSNIPSGAEALVIGSLGNLGRVNEAKHLFGRLLPGLELEDQIAARYHLGVTFTRHSQYPEAVKLFATNLLESKRTENPIIKFYGFMGLGFYRFFCSRFGRCIESAERALLGAQDAGFTYGKYQAYELLGHAKINVGRVSEGMSDIRITEKLASSFGNGSIIEAFKIARTCYEVQFGLRSHQELVSLLDATPTQNTYSRATLLLELSRVTALRGNVGEAQSYLNQASRIIYETRHRRYGSYLNFRYAYHAYLSGRFEEALSLLRAGQSALHEGVDRLLLLKILDLELKVRKAAQLSPNDDKSIEDRISKLSRLVGNTVADRILARRNLFDRVLKVPIGEDPIGDTLDLESNEKLGVDGFLTPLRERLNLPFGKQCIILDAVGELSLLVDFAETRALTGVTTQLKSLLLALNAGMQCKANVVAKVWGYKNYDSLRHDPILFQSITRLRHILGPQRDWVINTEDGYALKENVSIIAFSKAAISSIKRPNLIGDIVESDPQEDSRIQSAKSLFGERRFTTKQYMSELKVSKATACRDLGELVDSKVLKKVGNGKSTVYIFQ